MEVVMLERYFIKPATIDRICANWLGPHIERYVEWLNSEGYAERNVFRRVPILCQFGEFVQHQGGFDLASATSYIEPLCGALAETSRQGLSHKCRTSQDYGGGT
jgi:hypothetical protein